MRTLCTLLLSTVIINVFAQTSASTALSIPGVAVWNNNQPTYTNFCLSSVAAQSANSCPGSMTDVVWLKFTVPATLSAQPVYSSSVRISIVPTGFDAIVEFYSGTSASPVFRQCVNAAGSGTEEILRTDPNAPTNNPITPGVEYYVRVSSTSDVASGCFNAGVQYYPGVYISNGQWPNPPVDLGMPGYKVNQGPQRNSTPPQNAPNLQVLIQATRWRFVDTDLPPGSPGCTYDVNSNFSSAILNNVSCVCYGNSYNVYAQARYEGHWAGETEVRVLNLEATPSSSVTIPTVQCTTIGMSGTVQASALSNTTQYQWEWCNLGTCNTYQSGVPGLTVMSPSQVPCIRFNRTYTVRVKASYCGVWGDWSAPFCIRTPPIGYTQMSNCPAAPVTTGFVAYTQILSGANSYSWVLAPVNPASPLTPIGPAITVTTTGAGAYALGFSALGLIPGTTYRVQVKPRSVSCGFTQEGDYGTWCLVTIAGGTPMMLEPEEELETGIIEKIEYVNYDFVANAELNFFSLVGKSPEALTFSVPEQKGLEKGSLRLMTLSGQLLAEQTVVRDAERGAVDFLLAEKPSTGIYLVQYIASSGQTLTEKVFLD